MATRGTSLAGTAQAFFERIDNGPASVLASSLRDDHAERHWLERIQPHLPPDELSRPALSYLTFGDGEAAVLRRTHDRHAPGVVRAHALLGTSDQLTADIALAATDWIAWLNAPPTDRQVPPPQLPDPSLLRFSSGLRTRALHQGDKLARALAWLLQSPDTPLGLIGCPEDDRVALLWALREIGATELPGHAWTFATAGDPEPGGAIAAVTFFTSQPKIGLAPDRIVVDLDADQGASPQNEYRANALVYRFEYGEDPPDPTVHTVPEPIVAAAPAIPPSVNAHNSTVTATRRAGEFTDLVQALASARNGNELEIALRQLEDAVDGVDSRDDVRAELEKVHWATRMIHRHVPVAEWEQAFDRVVRVAFGFGEPDQATPTAHADAARLAELSRSDGLVRALARAVDGTELALALARRWIRQNPPYVPDPTAGLGGLGLFLHRRGLTITPRQEKRLQLCLLLLILLVAFAAGYLTGGRA